MRCHFRHAADCVLEDLRALLVDVMHTLLDSFLAGRMKRTAARHVEKSSSRAIHVVLEIENPLAWPSGLEQDRAGAIAEKDARGAIGIVQNGSHGIASNDHDLLVRSCSDKLRADREGIGKAGTCGGEVKAPGFFCADALLHQAGGGREKQ